jgi:hypothetical protein
MNKFLLILVLTLTVHGRFFSQNVVSNKSSTWNDATAWTPNGVPSGTNNVTISNGHTINITSDANCNSLTVGNGGAALLNFSGNTARTLSVTTDITVNSSATLNIVSNSNTTHTINTKGNLINNGVFDIAIDGNTHAYMIFSKNGNQTITGTGSITDFYKIEVNMGTSINNILDISSSALTASSNFLTLTNGIFKLSSTGATTLIPYTGTGTIPVTAGLWLNSANAVVSASADINLSGLLKISAGNMDMGNGNNDDLISTGGTLIITGGSLDIAGKYNASTGAASTFSISGGTLIMPSVTTNNTGIAPFHMTVSGSQFNMTGGLINIRREGGSGAQDLGFVNTGATSGVVTGGTLQLGNSTTPASQTISVNSSYPIYNLAVSSASVTAKVLTNALTVSNNITISSGTINANNLGITLGGSWSNSGSFVPGTGTVTFNSGSAQSIFKSGGETFNHLFFGGAGTKTFAGPVTTSSNFSIASGSAVDVSTSNYSLTVKGNFTNNGTFTSRAGLVTLNGTSAQSIGGTSVTDFYDLTLNNTLGATLNNGENLLGALTLSNGVLSINSQSFTMVSTTTATARIAQITGSGDISGNITVQRLIPGGTTGWGLLGNPISSALTLSDWDDDLYISCATCPDGSASGFTSIYTYDETVSGAYDNSNAYVAMNGVTDAIVAGKGYWVYLGTGSTTSGDLTLDVTGTPRKFNYTIPLSYSNFGSSADDGWNLISNPYPSPISWSALKGVTSNIDNAIYAYNADLNSGSGAFASYVNGISSPAVGSGGIGNTIPMGQAFYVHSTGATGLSAQESNKTTGNPTFLRPANNGLSSLLRINLAGGTFFDETVLYLQPTAQDTFDDLYDSYKMRGQDPYAPYIALQKNSKEFQINGIAPISGNFSMPLKVYTGYSGTYTIGLSNVSSFPLGACITLYDKFTASTTDLKSQDYAFFLSDTTMVARFDINITIDTLSISSALQQPDCSSPSAGKIVAKGLSSGPWNYLWRLNGNVIKTSLNVAGTDSLDNLNSGTVDLEINTAGTCDNNQSGFFIVEKIPATAQFYTSADTLDITQASLVQFFNNSVNSVSNFWDFGPALGTSTLQSPAIIFDSLGYYPVMLIVESSTGCQDTAYGGLFVWDSSVPVKTITKNKNSLLVKTLDNNTYGLYQMYDAFETTTLKLYDATGKLLRDFGKIDGSVLNLTLDLHQYYPGIYFVDLITSQGRQVVKLLVR